MMRKNWFSLCSWILVIVYCAIIYNITSSPASTSQHTSEIIKEETNAPPNIVHNLNVGVRKLGHITLFGGLGLLLLLVFWKRRYAPIIAWFLASLSGAADEFHQRYVPNRTPAITDVFIDSAGAAAAIMLFFSLRKVISHYKQKRSS